VTENNNPETGDTGYDKSEASVKKIIFWGAVSVTVFVIAAIWIVDFFTAVKEEVTYQEVLSPVSKELRDLRARETEALTSYKLLDPDKGTYRIPIDRAMKLMADEAYQKKKEETGE